MKHAFKHAWRIVFLGFSVERLRKHKEADRRRREAEIPEQHCARLKAYCQKRKAESTQSECSCYQQQRLSQH